MVDAVREMIGTDYGSPPKPTNNLTLLGKGGPARDRGEVFAAPGRCRWTARAGGKYSLSEA